MPLDPHKLGAAGGADHLLAVVDAVNAKGGIAYPPPCPAARGQIPAAVGNQGGGDNVGVAAVDVLRLGWIRNQNLRDKADDPHPQLLENINVGGILSGGGPSPGLDPQVGPLQKHGEYQVLVGQAAHLEAEIPGTGHVEQGGLSGRHGVHDAVIVEVGDGLQEELIVPADKPLIGQIGNVGAGHVNDETYHTFIGKIVADGFNIISAASGNHGGQRDI